MRSQPHFPIFVNLKGRRIVVVGGGDTAYRRAKALIRFGAEVRIIAPKISPEITKLVRDGEALWLQAEFEPQLLKGADLVVAATNLREINHAVGEAAKKMLILVNVADSRAESSFLFPAVIQSDSLVAGVVAADNDCAAVKRAAQRLLERLIGGRL